MFRMLFLNKGMHVINGYHVIKRFKTGLGRVLINTTGPLLEVPDFRVETTVERRDILMMGPAKCDLASLIVVL